MKFKEYGLEIEILGYEKYKYDKWANVLWKIHNGYINYENSSYDIEIHEIEKLKILLKDFLNNKVKENVIFEPTESAFRIEFYPKGRDYGRWIDPKSNEALILPEVQLYVYFVDENDYSILDASFNCVMDKTDVEDLYKYLIKITT